MSSATPSNKPNTTRRLKGATAPAGLAADPAPIPVVRTRTPASPSAPPAPPRVPVERAAPQIQTTLASSGQRPSRRLGWSLVTLGLILTTGILAGGLIGIILSVIGLIVWVVGVVRVARGKSGSAVEAHQRRRRLRWPLIATVLLIVTAATGITGYLMWHNGSGHTVLPFAGLDEPEGVAVDSAGNVYVVDRNDNRILELPAGSSTQVVLPFSGLNYPQIVSVDAAGNVCDVPDLNQRPVAEIGSRRGGANRHAAPWHQRFIYDSRRCRQPIRHTRQTVGEAGSRVPARRPCSRLATSIRSLGVAVDPAGEIYARRVSPRPSTEADG